MSRHDGRTPDQLRPISFQRGFTNRSQGSVLTCFGETRVLCTATVTDAGWFGPLTGALVGAVFGAVRIAVMTSVSLGVGEDEHADGYRALRAGKSRGWRAITGLGALGVIAALVAGCSGQRATLTAPDQPVPEQSIVDPTAATEPRTTDTGPPAATDGPDQASNQTRTDPSLRGPRPASLEDVVRTDLAPITEQEPATGAAEDGPVVTPAEEGAPPVEPATAAAVASAAGELSTDLIDSIDGFQPIAEPLADRFLDLPAAADIQPDPSEETALLETRGFQGGWMRAFRSEANDVAVATVYEFADEGEAEFYLEDGLITIGGYGGKFFDVDDMPGVRGFVQTARTEAGPGAPEVNRSEALTSLGAAFHQGRRWYLVYLVGSSPAVSADVLLPAIARQRELAAAPSIAATGD